MRLYWRLLSYYGGDPMLDYVYAKRHSLFN